MNERKKAVWLLPSLIGLAVVALVTIALVREPAQLDPNTPEGAVQEYLQAIADQDHEKAFELLFPESFSGCDPSDIAVNAPREPFTATLGFDDGFGGEEFGRFGPEEFPGTTFPGETVRVNVTLTFSSGGPFGGSWEQYESFSLTSSEGFWWIVNDPWPYFRWRCEEGF